LALSVWVTLSLSTWVLVRQRSIWEALLPVVGLLALNSYYTGGDWAPLIVSLAAGLLLAGNMAQDRLESRWDSDALPYGVRGERWITTAILTSIIGIAMLLTIQLTDPEFRRQVHDTLFPPESASAGGRGSGSDDERSSPGVWPREHLLGSGPDNSEIPIMSVRVPGVSHVPFYWQATSYSAYTGRGWEQSASRFSNRGAGPIWPDSAEPPLHFALLRQSFRMEFFADQVYAAGRPVRLSQPVEGTWSDPGHMDLIEVKILVPQSAYEVLSWVPVATPDQLRTASQDYPEWISATYLPLPEELPERVTALARESTAGAPTAYEKALALQDYLRTYPYTLELDAPPADRDVVDYFLFDLKRGYCDYYASAMVVMARSVGLPARLAVGYATGAYDQDDQVYRISMAEAHSWPEIYFNEFGWIPFEPTSARTVIEYGEIDQWAEESKTAQQAEIEAFETESTPGKGIPASRLWLLALIPLGVVLVVVGILAVAAIRMRRYRRGTPRQIIAFLYRQLLRSGRRLGLMLSASQTPHEFLAAFRSELALRAQSAPRRMGNWEIRQEETNRAVADLVSLYTDAYYSPRQPDPAAVHKMLDAWPRLAWALWMFWLAGRGQIEE
jgi:transglutaminase-like putative cysteine protease